jgi:Arsenical resistance operon protein ArsD
MTIIEVFEPALCCATGVCGQDIDQDLVTFSADLDFVRSQGGDARRYNLASEPLAFAQTAAVKAFLQVVGSPGLPVVLVDGVTVMTGGYPDRAQLATWAGLDLPVDTAAVQAPAGVRMLGLSEGSHASGSCCSSSGAAGCC